MIVKCANDKWTAAWPASARQYILYFNRAQNSKLNIVRNVHTVWLAAYYCRAVLARCGHNVHLMNSNSNTIFVDSSV